MTRYIRPDLVIANNDGTPTREFIREWNALVDQVGGQGRDFVGETKGNTDGIIAGTRQLADVQISGRGSLSNILDAQSSNINAATTAGGGGALTATVSPSFATGGESESTTVTVTTSSVTVTALGGTAPYTCAVAKQNAGAEDINPISANPPASGGGLNEFVITHQKDVEPGGYYSTNYCATVTDDVGATFEVCYSVEVINLGGDGEF